MKAIAEGRFREDLYYRLNTVPIVVPALRERPEDIHLLFRRFASDVALQYKMPAIALNEEARALLENYYWRGNIRQLKNVAEQISIIENTREITADTLRKYLPANEMHSGLALLGANTQNTRDTFMNERELLYKVLFDMKRDMTEMRQQLNGLLATTAAPAHRNTEMVVSNHTAYEPVEEVEDAIAHAPIRAEVVEDAVLADELALTTMEEIERESIRRALERNNGSRKMAANELHISERTLYRKIKEYHL